jgi:RNA polymerase sigma factor (sigma-70 family)
VPRETAFDHSDTTTDGHAEGISSRRLRDSVRDGTFAYASAAQFSTGPNVYSRECGDMTSSQTSKTPDVESVFLASLPTVDRIVGLLGARHGLSQADLEEFGSWARARLLDDGYSILRRFQGRSSLGTYLSVVLANLFKDFRNSRWGRWRSSAAARRLGPVAVRLETLLYRDVCPAHEAIEILKATGVTEVELRKLAGRIPPRAPAREVELDAVIESVQAPESADRAVRTAEGSFETTILERAVADAIGTLPPEDRVIVRMRFWDDFSVADIARTLGIDQKPLYRRLEVIKATLGAALAVRGIARTQVVEMLMHEGTD